MHRPRVKVYLQGQEDAIFELSGFGHQLREGDLFSYTTPVGTSDYKVESSKLRLTQIVAGGIPEKDQWDDPTLEIVVSVVP